MVCHLVPRDTAIYKRDPFLYMGPPTPLMCLVVYDFVYLNRVTDSRFEINNTDGSMHSNIRVVRFVRSIAL